MRLTKDVDAMPPLVDRTLPQQLPTGCEAMWGRLTLIGRPPGYRDQWVYVKVYRTSLEHFAVVYPDKLIAKPMGCLNLKHSRVEPLANCERSFRVVQRSIDGGTVEFRSESNASLTRWLSALEADCRPAGKCSPHTANSLPVVEEDEEE